MSASGTTDANRVRTNSRNTTSSVLSSLANEAAVRPDLMAFFALMVEATTGHSARTTTAPTTSEVDILAAERQKWMDVFSCETGVDRMRIRDGRLEVGGG